MRDLSQKRIYMQVFYLTNHGKMRLKATSTVDLYSGPLGPLVKLGERLHRALFVVF